MKNRIRAIGGFIIAALFLFIGLIAYPNDYYIEIWGIPLSGAVFFIIAGVLFVGAVISLVVAPKQDREDEQAQLTTLIRQQNPSEEDVSARTPLTVPCTVVLTHTKGIIGLAMSIFVTINGELVGKVRQKGSLRVSTSVAENDVAVLLSGNSATAAISFTAEPNGVVNLNLIVNTGWLGATVTIEQV